MPNTFQILILNQISANGLKRLPAERYTTGKEIKTPDAVLVRSADMQNLDDAASEFDELILRPLRSGEPVLYTAEVPLHDVSGNHLATGRITWQIKDWGQVRTKV